MGHGGSSIVSQGPWILACVLYLCTTCFGLPRIQWPEVPLLVFGGKYHPPPPAMMELSR